MIDVIQMAKIIEQKGGKLYLVGGALRDRFLGKPILDEDFCVTGILSSQFQELFPNAIERGKYFPVFSIEDKEFAMARRETKNGKGHKEFLIQTDTQITIEEDLARRDITINSIAQDVLTQEIIDPFNGRKDIENKMIRATTKAFMEDPLRAYRVARFAAKLQFDVEEQTIQYIKQLKPELETVSKERVFSEFKKALSTDKPSLFFQVLRKAEILEVHFKEIQDLIGKIQPIKYHPEGDSYNHTMIVVDNGTRLTNKLEVRFSALVHDLGKGVTPEEILPHHYKHDQKGVELVGNLGKRICVPTTWIKCGKTACREHMRGGIFGRMCPSKKVLFLERVSKSILGLDGLQIVVLADKGDRNTKPSEIQFVNIGEKCLQEINGEYIKQKYGKIEGIEIAHKLHEERVKWMQQKERDNK